MAPAAAAKRMLGVFDQLVDEAGKNAYQEVGQTMQALRKAQARDLAGPQAKDDANGGE